MPTAYLLELRPDGVRAVHAVESGTLRPLETAGPISWGDTGPGATLLARIILQDLLGDEIRAARLAQRLKWRLLKDLPAGAEQEIPAARVLAHVADIERVETEMAPHVRRDALQPGLIPPAAGYGGGAVWDSDPALTPNITKGRG